MDVHEYERAIRQIAAVICNALALGFGINPSQSTSSTASYVAGLVESVLVNTYLVPLIVRRSRKGAVNVFPSRILMLSVEHHSL